MKDVQWWEQTRCSIPGIVSDEDIFPEEWHKAPTPRMIRCCNMCPVRVECLNDAMEKDPTGQDLGVRGGLTTYQRRQTMRRQLRQRCPGCLGTETQNGKNVQICLTCGQSWSTQLSKVKHVA